MTQTLSPPTASPRLRAKDHLVFDHVSGVLSALDQRVVEAVPPGGNWRDLPSDFPSQRIRQIRDSASRGEGSRSTYYGRLRWDRPSYTISTYITRPGNGCFIHPSANRLITVREAARLQTFPDSWRFAGTIRQRSVQIGNAVPPLLAYQVAREFPAGSAVDLFAGAGGLSLGLQLAGHEVVASVDNDQRAIDTHRRNLGSSALLADLDSDSGRELAWLEIRNLVGRDLELLAGGPPCQGFSTAGKALQDDPRNRLLWSFVEAIDKFRPRTVLMENVVALAQSRGRSHLAALRQSLVNLGYEVEVAILHAEAYGVPQRRRRVVLQASRGSSIRWPRPWRATMEPAFLISQPFRPPTTVSPMMVSDAISDLPEAEAPVLDESVSASPSHSDLQSFLRGEVSAESFLDGHLLDSD